VKKYTTKNLAPGCKKTSCAQWDKVFKIFSFVYWQRAGGGLKAPSVWRP